jgi:putative transposase
VRDVYTGIDQLVITESFKASKVCDLLEASRSGFSAWRRGQESRRAVRDRELISRINAVFWRHRRRYGARRIAVELASEGIACGVAQVARLLKTQGFRAIQPRSYQPRTTESRHRLGYNQNLLAGRGAPRSMDEVWVGDITYIPLVARSGSGRFGYLALLMDLWSRRIVGWEYGSSMDEDLVLGALRRAIKERQPTPGLIYHTDRGGQFAEKRYREVLRRAGMRQSMRGGELLRQCVHGVVLRDGQDGTGAGGVRRGCGGGPGDLGVHSVLQRGASSFVAGLRQPCRVRESTGCPEIREWTVRAT